jgi:hypothetical protein
MLQSFYFNIMQSRMHVGCMCQNHLLTNAARSACFYVVYSVPYYHELHLRRLFFDSVLDSAHNSCYNCNDNDIMPLLQLLA